MKFATYTADGTRYYGAAAGGGMIALSPMFPQWPSLREVIAAGGLGQLSQATDGTSAVTHASGSFTYSIPIPFPEKIICVGVNYPDRNAEYKDGVDAPPNMSLFIRFPRSFVGHGVPLYSAEGLGQARL